MARSFSIRRQRGFTTIAMICFAALYLPIGVLVFYSFNAGESLASFDGISLRWFQKAFENKQVIDASLRSLQIAAIAAVVSTIAATMAALATTRTAPYRGLTIKYAFINQPLMIPEIVTAVALLIFFARIKIWTGYAGVGYLIAATPGVLSRAEGGGEITVDTFLHVREDALQLYGFVDAGERQLFLQLLTVSGVGPKVALAVVSGSPAPELRRAIALEDHARFQAIPGIGKRTAERIVLELKEKVSLTADDATAYAAEETPTHLVARDALVELGYTVLEAEQRLQDVDPELPPAERVRLALRAG